MKKSIIVAGIIIVLAGLIFLVTTNTTDDALVAESTTEIEFYETDNGQFTMQYDAATSTAKLSLNGVQYDLKKSESDTGTRYESADKSVVFFETEGQANVEVGGELIFENAVMTERKVEVLKSNKQGDPAANKYDFNDGTSANNVDNDCDDPNGDGDNADSTCAPGDPIPGIDITNDGNAEIVFPGETATEPAETTEADSETSVSGDARATDYNSSRSNKSY